MKRIFSVALLVFVFFQCENPSEAQQTQDANRGVIAENAMVVAAHPLAAQVGLDILKKGGNAFDAAIAVHFSLAVVYQRAGNIGGGGFAVIRTKDGEALSLDFREKAPKAARKDMYQDADGNVIKGLSREGHLAAGVPGSVDGMVKIHEKFGSLPWRELVQPAIKQAYEGYTVTEFAAQTLMRFQEDFIKHNGKDFYLVKDWIQGDQIAHPDLARTLALIRDMGRDGFYKGTVAGQILEEMREGGGIMTAEDLEEYESVWRDPLQGSYRGHNIITMGPPSSGGVAILQMLQGSEAFPFGEWGFNSTETVHAMVELERRVYADRATYLGDPDFYNVPLDMLLSPEYNKKRFSDISMDKKTPSSEVKEGSVDVIESVETTHYSIVDKEGNAISVTTTINGLFGNKVFVDGAGFFLNNEMDDFSVKPGVPNQFGLVGGEANSIKPEKRMLSSMTPTIVEKDGGLFLVIGTPGGSTIITSVYQTILNVIDHGMTMQEAVDAKKIHSQWLPDAVIVEEGALDNKVTRQLEKLGHELRERGEIGRMECIMMLPDGRLEGAPDNKRQGDVTALGY